MRGDTCVEKVFALLDEFGDAFEPERLGHISLGQENSRMRMNAAPGLFSALNTNPERVPHCCSALPFQGKITWVLLKPGALPTLSALPQADLPRPVGPNRRT